MHSCYNNKGDTFMKSILFKINDALNTYDPADIMFKDLNLDDVIAEVLRRAKLFDIKKYYYTPLKNKEDIIYRHEVFKDLENKELFDDLNVFSYTMNRKLQELKVAKTVKFEVYKQIELKKKIEDVIEIMRLLVTNLDKYELKSEALKMMKKYVSDFLSSKEVEFVLNDMKLITEEMKKVKYRLAFENGVIKIAKEEKEEVVLDIINDTISAYLVDNPISFSLDYGQLPVHFLGQIYREIAKMYPIEFKHLELFSKHFDTFIDDVIVGFSNDIQFYISYIEIMDRIKSMGLSFSIPTINEGHTYCQKGYDMALALKFYVTGAKIVVNDFMYDKGEYALIISGPNQGGKTTFSRYVGQVFYLAMLGLPVSGVSSSIDIVDRVYTMYEVEEDSSNLNGKLKSELLRIKNIMDSMQKNSLFVLNEVFSSTALEDGIILGKKVMELVKNKGSKMAFVTFIEELSKNDSGTVSMGSMVDKNDPSIRTFEILRKNDNSNTYAKSIASKNHVSYDDIIRRVE